MIKKISLLVPCYNEQECLQLFYDAACKMADAQKNYEWEFLFVNDGSTDNTLSLMKQLHRDDARVSYLDLSRNFGKENAMLAGFDYVSGDCMVVMDADLQDPPELVPTMLEKWEEGYDDVYAKRRSRGKESLMRKAFSLTFYKILQASCRFDVLENVGDFRLLDRSCINALRQLREKERYTKGLFAWIGYRKYELLFDRSDRSAGKSSWNFFSLLNLAVEGITSFTVAPLRFATYFGLFISLASFGLMSFFLGKALIYGDAVAGFPTLISVILFLGGVQLIALGLIGEYLGRIFNGVKKRPSYLVREHNEQKIIISTASKNEF